MKNDRVTQLKMELDIAIKQAISAALIVKANLETIERLSELSFAQARDLLLKHELKIENLDTFERIVRDGAEHRIFVVVEAEEQRERRRLRRAQKEALLERLENVGVSHDELKLLTEDE